MAMTARAEIHFIIDQAIQNMQRIQDEARATGETVGGAFTGTDQDLASYNQALNTVGRSFVVTGAAITGTVGLAVNSFMSFEQQMDAVGAVSNATAEQMEDLSATALRVGQETSFNANEVGAAMEILAKAGVPLQAIIDGVAEGAVRLSEATGVDITLSAETAAAAMTVFNHTADETDYVMNVIAQSANASMLDVDDWTSALMYAGPVVSSLGYSIEDLAHMMVILGDAGMRGSVASTSIRNILMQISDTSSKATEGIRGYNIAMTNADGTSRTLMEIMTDLVPHWNELNDAARVDLANQWFGARGGPAFLNMMNAHTEAVNRGGNAFEEAGLKMEATGDIYTMSEKRMDNLAGSMERLRGSVETLMISFGERLAPAIRVVVDILDKVIDTIANSHPVFQTIVMVLAALSGGALLLGGSMMLLLPQILATQQALAKLGGMRGVLTLLVGPIRAIGMAFMTSLGPIALVAAAATALYFAWKNNFLGIRDLVDSFIGWIGEAWGAVKPFIDGVLGFFGIKHSTTGEFDVESTTDEGFDTYTGMVDNASKNASLAITTQPDDMFIEWVYDADGTVIGYDVKITSSTDGTEQTGRILSSSRDANNPDLIHMEVELASGETVQGTYSEIEGTFSQIPGNVEVGATLVGDAYIVKERELDGVMTWVITESANPETGEVFATILDSYSGEQGEAFILVQPDGDGPAFWQKVDLETGIPTDIKVPIDADTGMFDGRLKVVRAENEEHTVIVDAYDEPFARVLDGIMDPATGNKLITLQLANGDTFVVEVDAVTGSIVSQREVTITADTEDAETKVSGLRKQFEEIGGLISHIGELFRNIWLGDWDKIDWMEDLGLNLLIDEFVEAGEIMYGWIEDIGNAWSWAMNNGMKYLEWFNREVINRESGPQDTGQMFDQGTTPTGHADNYYPVSDRERSLHQPTGSAYSDPYRPTEGGAKGIEQYKIDPITISDLADFGKVLGDASGMAELLDQALVGLDRSTLLSNSSLNTTASTVPMVGISMRTTDEQVRGAAGGIAGSGDLVGSSFGAMAASVLMNTGLAASMGALNFSTLNQSVVANSLGARLGASANFASLQSVASSQFGSMRSDTQSKMSALQGAVASSSTQARSVGSSQFSQMSSTLGSHFSTMKNNASTSMSQLQSTVSTQTAKAKSNAESEMTGMNSAVAMQMLGMQLATHLKLSLMASQAKTETETMADNMESGSKTGASNVNTQLAKVSGYVTAQGVLAASRALIAGLNIGDSFARGMEAMLGRIRAAANRMVAEANRAIIAKAMISSPSKLFMRLGEYMGEGVEVGILDKIAAVERASERLVHVPKFEGGFNTGAGVGQVSSLGGASINVTIVTLPHAEWARFNEAQTRNSRFVESWQTPEAIAQYLGGK